MEELHAPGTEHPRIFVSIAAYRDSECQWTLRDLFEKATFPERVFPGVVFQYLPDKDQHCFQFETRPEQVRMLKLHALESRGACWARHLVQSLWQGEEYYLQIDSHMRFEPDWDERLIRMLELCPASKPVLSTYPPGYEPPDNLNPKMYCTLTVRGIDDNGLVSLIAASAPLSSAPEIPLKNPFLAAGFIFARGQFIQEVPYDPHLYFSGEEITLAARAFTHGWDLFTPTDVICYHHYNRKAPVHWSDHEKWHLLNRRAVARVRHLLGLEQSTDPEVLVELDRFGLGTVRTFSEYEALSGIDFSQRRFLKRIFQHIYSTQAWGKLETISGPGSTLHATRAMRSGLHELLRVLEISSLLDVGCGDCNWISSLFPELDLYIGTDIVADLIESNRKRFETLNHVFFKTIDFTHETLPATDVLLIRDCLTHYSNTLVKATLQHLATSKHRYFLISSNKSAENVDISVGEWRPVDLLSAPFQLPPPRMKIAESDPNKFLYLYKREDLAGLLPAAAGV